MWMPHEKDEQLALTREALEVLKAILAAVTDKPGQGPAVQPIAEEAPKSGRK